MRLLTVNLGSSSLKLSVLDDEDRLLSSATLKVRDGRVEEPRLGEVVASFGGIDAVGHRVVHGGTDFTDPVLVDDAVLTRLWALRDLAPLHLPPCLQTMQLVRQLLPDVATVACFDTAFHASMPPHASTYALPRPWRVRFGLRRFGFHGLSHAYATRRASAMGSSDANHLRVVSCHLGSGASLAAVQGGRSIDTTMGFTPLEGLVMATRSGSVDPGLILWLQESTGIPPAEVTATLEYRSGLAGLTGSADMEEILQVEGRGDPDAALGIGVYLHRLRAGVASMASAMDGLDILVFTGGVGERAASIRQRTVDRLGFLGLGIDRARNETAHPDCDVTAQNCANRVLIIEAREDLEIALGIRSVLGRA